MAPIYSEAQVAQFLSFLQIPKEYYIDSEPVLDLAFLTVLHQHMISTVPFENLKIHYSENRQIILDPESLFKKIVTDGRGRGGYCMEGNLLMSYMLHALGFNVYPVGVRARLRENGVPTGGYLGWTHVVLIVTLPNNNRYVVDVSYGGDGPTQPMPLVEDQTFRNLGTQEGRLIYDHIPGQTQLTPGRRLWIYQGRNSPDLPWQSFYCFSHTVEWLPEDFEVSNFYTGAHPISPMTFKVLAVKFLRRECRTSVTGEEIYGKRMLVDGVVKENTGEKTKVVMECKTEVDRIEALKEWFGIELTGEEREAIKGHKTELI